MQRRRKTGGIVDRRFGEDNPTMTPEEKALERFVKEKQRSSKKASIFDLEDVEEDVGLTHMGNALSSTSASRIDDFKEEISDGSDDQMDAERPSKRQKLGDVVDKLRNDLDESHGADPSKRLTKTEVMNEVIKKSKLYKYERQQAKEDDEDLRTQLDEGLSDIFGFMRGPQIAANNVPARHSPKPENGMMNPDRLALLNGQDKTQADKEYDERLKEMSLDLRAKPTERTQTVEEKLQQEANRLEELEERRLKRMRGETEDTDSEPSATGDDPNLTDEQSVEEVEVFGLGKGLSDRPKQAVRDVESEDEFDIEDFVASGSELDMASDGGSSIEDEALSGNAGNEEHDDFVDDLLSRADLGREGFAFSAQESNPEQSSALPYTYPCPSSLEEFQDIVKEVPPQSIPTVVQRIRALYQPHFAQENKEKLATFAAILVQFISVLAEAHERPSSSTLEALTRHIHSMAKSYPMEISTAFRDRLQNIHDQRPTNLNVGDLVTFVAIGSIYPTSDHFHQVVTPAILCMTRYLEQKVPSSLSDLSTGSFICTLCIQYQKLARRYIPELLNYAMNAMSALLPKSVDSNPPKSPRRPQSKTLQIRNPPINVDFTAQPLGLPDFWAVKNVSMTEGHQELHRQQLLHAYVAMLDTMVSLWVEQSAFCEIFAPVRHVLHEMSSTCQKSKLHPSLLEKTQKAASNIQTLLSQSLQRHQPLRLHNHRPLAIKTSIPKFEEDYNPDKHYDHDRDRAELAKLKSEHKKERKGALRELRKDAGFLARESLREKREADAAYEKKYKRLVAEIQGEEGREANLYEREKNLRKKSRK